MALFDTSNVDVRTLTKDLLTPTQGVAQAQAQQPSAGALSMVRPSASLSEDVRQETEERLLGRYYGDDEVEGSLAQLKKDRDAKLRRLADQMMGYEPISEAEKFFALGRGLTSRIRRDGGSSLAQTMQNIGSELAPVAEKQSRLKQEYKMNASRLLAEQAMKDYETAQTQARDYTKILLEKKYGAGSVGELHRRVRMFTNAPEGSPEYVKEANRQLMFLSGGESGKTMQLMQENPRAYAALIGDKNLAKRIDAYDKIEAEANKADNSWLQMANGDQEKAAQLKAAYIKQQRAKIDATFPTDVDVAMRGLEPIPTVGGTPQAPSAQPEAPRAGGGFEAVVGNVLQREGGYTPKDGMSGAPANFGINQKANPDIDVKNLSPEKAKDVYKTRYWDAIGADKLSPAAQEVAFDAAVNQGAEYAKKLIDATGGDPQKMIEQRRRDYIKIVEANPKQVSQFKGWMNRLDDVATKAGITSPTGQIPDELPLGPRAEPTTAPKVEVGAPSVIPVEDVGKTKESEKKGEARGTGAGKAESLSIEGSPENINLRKDQAADKEQINYLETTFNGIMDDINNILGKNAATDVSAKPQEGYESAVGPIDWRVPSLRKSTSNVTASIEGILDKLSIQNLQQIRKQGTSPGSITEKEWPIFQNALVTLKPTMSEEQFRAQLMKVKQAFENLISKSKQSYANKYKNLPTPGGTEPPTTDPENPLDLIIKNRKRKG